MENRKYFKDRLCELRKSHDLTQKQIAKDLGLVHQSVGNWETGLSVPNLSTFEKLCEYFNVSADYLLGLSDARERKG